MVTIAKTMKKLTSNKTGLGREVYYFDVIEKKGYIHEVRKAQVLDTEGGQIKVEALNEIRANSIGGILHYLWKYNKRAANILESKFAQLCNEIGINHWNYRT